VERDAGELAWVRVPPHVIIDNWSLPSLALVMHDHHPGAVLLEPGDCRRLEATGMVRVDPWSVLSTRLLNQLFGPVTARTS
jgi:hypothetical protein